MMHPIHSHPPVVTAAAKEPVENAMRIGGWVPVGSCAEERQPSLCYGEDGSFQCVVVFIHKQEEALLLGFD